MCTLAILLRQSYDTRNPNNPSDTSADKLIDRFERTATLSDQIVTSILADYQPDATYSPIELVEGSYEHALIITGRLLTITNPCIYTYQTFVVRRNIGLRHCSALGSLSTYTQKVFEHLQTRLRGLDLLTLRVIRDSQADSIGWLLYSRAQPETEPDLNLFDPIDERYAIQPVLFKIGDTTIAVMFHGVLAKLLVPSIYHPEYLEYQPLSQIVQRIKLKGGISRQWIDTSLITLYLHDFLSFMYETDYFHYEYQPEQEIDPIYKPPLRFYQLLGISRRTAYSVYERLYDFLNDRRYVDRENPDTMTLHELIARFLAIVSSDTSKWIYFVLVIDNKRLMDEDTVVNVSVATNGAYYTTITDSQYLLLTNTTL